MLTLGKTQSVVPDQALVLGEERIVCSRPTVAIVEAGGGARIPPLPQFTL